jgi:UMF1 family MFS transporter
MGYLGGGILFLANVMMTLMPRKFGLSGPESAVKVSFISVALWWGFFTVFTILWVPETKEAHNLNTGSGFLREGFSRLSGTFKKIRSQKNVFLFLLAYWFYIDGVDTIIRMAVDYGMSLGFDSRDLIVSLLIVQFVGFPSALLLGKLGEIWGVRRSIFLSIGIYLFVVIWGTMMTTRDEFYCLAVVIGLSQGGIQALSRSYFSRLIPPDRTAEYFGFYNMLGKFAVIFGPALVGLTGLAVKKAMMPPSPSALDIERIGQFASRAGIASILLLFIAGGMLLRYVRDEKK